jgi:hypothetical protein
MINTEFFLRRLIEYKKGTKKTTNPLAEGKKVYDYFIKFQMLFDIRYNIWRDLKNIEFT